MLYDSRGDPPLGSAGIDSYNLCGASWHDDAVSMV
jgi:hypothetical protein